MYAYERVEDGSEYLKNILRHYDFWKESYHREEETLVLQGSDYIDDCKHSMLSRVGFTIFMLSIVEAYGGGATVNNFATSILMIANSKGTKRCNYNPFWKAFTNDLHELARGE
jgi:hypothetical protein